MTWKLLNIAQDGLKYAEIAFAKKAKFLVDENLEGAVVELLREIGWNALGVSEIGLNGHEDEDVFAAAWREDRVLLTNDRDYLNGRRFPEHKNPGVIVLPDASFGSDDFIRALRLVVHIIGPMRNLFKKAKVEISRDNTMTVILRNFETGEMEKNRYLLGAHNETYEWVDENK